MIKLGADAAGENAIAAADNLTLEDTESGVQLSTLSAAFSRSATVEIGLGDQACGDRVLLV